MPEAVAAPAAAPRNPPPAVVLVRPYQSGNVGAVARAMANMGLARLILVEPAAAIDDTAREWATSGAAILETAERAPSLESAVAPFARVVGTTSDRARDRAVAARTPRELATLLAADPPGSPAALVFGPERSGLTREELALCDPVVTIPTALAAPTLNLAQAVLLVAYELHVAGAAGAAPIAVHAGREPLASAAMRESLLEDAVELLRRSRFARHDGFANVVRDLGSLLARAAPTDREARILRGVARRLRHALDGAGKGGRSGAAPSRGSAPGRGGAAGEG